MSLRLHLPPARRSVQALIAVAATVVVVGLAADLLARAVDSELLGLRRLTDVDDESSIPTWVNTTMWLVAAVVHALIAVSVGRDAAPVGDHVEVSQKTSSVGSFTRRWGWWLVAALCVGLSIDEASMIHELPIDRLRNALDADGVLRETWVIPGVIFCLGVVAVLWPWLRSLDKADQLGYLVAGSIFVAGSIGVEMIGSGIEDDRGEDSLAYRLSVSVEEFMEMAGVSVAIWVGLRIAHRRLTAIVIGAGEPGHSGAG